MANIFNRIKRGRSRDRPMQESAPRNALTPIWGALINAKARGDLSGSEAIYSAVSRIANTMASMPLHLYKDYEIQQQDPRERCVAYAPNPNVTPYNFKLAVETCRDTVGRAYILIVPGYDGVTVDRLDPIDPGRVEVLRNRDNGEIWYSITLDSGKQVLVHNTQMIALHHMSTDGITGISPIEVLGATLKYDQRIREISVDQLEGIKDSIVLTFPSNLSKEKREAYTTSFLDAYKRSRGHLITLDSGITAEKISGSVIDPKILEVDNITKRKVAAVYNMPPRMLGDVTASGYSTSEQDIAEFLKLTMIPIVKQWEEAFNRRLLTYAEIQDGYTFRFDMDALKRGDTAAMADKHSKAIRSATMTPNDARKEDGLPPVPNGNELLVPRDLIPLRILLEHPEMLLTGKLEGDIKKDP